MFYGIKNNKIISIIPFQYMSQNIPGPGCNMNDFEEKLLGCKCQNCDDDCKCTATFGKPYMNYKIQTDFIGPSVKPVFECNMNCSCSIQCPNRIVQSGITIKLQIFLTDMKGLGLQTLEKISRGTFVCEYAGEIISLHEAKNRTKSQTEYEMNYILTVKEHCKNGVLRTYVDPSKYGNIGRYINHSCEPNLTMVPVRVDNMVPKICLFAVRDIEVLEELSFSYGTLNSQRKSSKICCCVSNNCTGFMPFDEELHVISE
jgi:histone-lysine N-methyltransferase SETMAR